MNLVFSVLWLILSIALTELFCRTAKGTGLMDKPNERSLHLKPILRGGGLVFIGLSLISVPVLAYYTNTVFSQFWVPFLCILILSSVSFMDDFYHLSPGLRFWVQTLVALLIVLFLRPQKLDFIVLVLHNPLIISIFLFINVIWAINHFNFMDGMDGFCATQSIFLLAVYTFLLNSPEALVYRDFCWMLALSLVGFLKFNFPPARLFMGDVGSTSLGLISFLIAVIGQQKFNIPIIYWFLLNSLFLFDATITLLRRLFNKEKWFAPHRKHAYQRLKQSGISARSILLGQFLINICSLFLVSLLAYHKLNLLIVLCMQIVILSLAYGFTEVRFPMEKGSTG